METSAAQAIRDEMAAVVAAMDNDMVIAAWVEMVKANDPSAVHAQVACEKAMVARGMCSMAAIAEQTHRIRGTRSRVAR